MDAGRAPDVSSVYLDGRVLVTAQGRVRLTTVRARMMEIILDNPHGYRSLQQLASAMGVTVNAVHLNLRHLRRDLRKVNLTIHNNRLCSEDLRPCKRAAPAAPRNRAIPIEPSCLLRLICNACLTVNLVKPTGQPPYCCGQRMLIAGHPKIDRFGLRAKGQIVDPIDNLLPGKLSTQEIGMSGLDLQEWRHRRGWTQRDLMKALGVQSRQTVSTWESSLVLPRQVELAVKGLEHAQGAA